MASSSVLHRRDIVADCGWWGDPLKLSRLVDMDYVRRVYLAGKRIECCLQLSVIKFPWRVGELTLETLIIRKHAIGGRCKRMQGNCMSRSSWSPFSS